NNSVKCYFINKPDSPYFESDVFKNIMEFIQQKTNKVKLRQAGKLFLLTIADIETMQQLLQFLEKMDRFIKEKIFLAQPVN
ncbi:MAG TPA: hypothetical protein VHZ50_03325, partial [Puia sp.]|nr:hypothetical protein [Puia sp.]